MRAKEGLKSKAMFRGATMFRGARLLGAVTLATALLFAPGIVSPSPAVPYAHSPGADGQAPQEVLLLAGADIPDYGYRCVRNRLSKYKDQTKPKVYFTIIKSFGIKVRIYKSTEFGLNSKSCYRSEKDGYQISVHLASSTGDRLCTFENTNRHEDFEVSQFQGLIRCRRY